MLQRSCTFAVAHFAVALEKSCFRSDEHVLGKKRSEAGGNDEVGAYAPKISAPLHVKKKMLNRFCLKL